LRRLKKKLFQKSKRRKFAKLRAYQLLPPNNSLYSSRPTFANIYVAVTTASLLSKYMSNLLKKRKYTSHLFRMMKKLVEAL